MRFILVIFFTVITQLAISQDTDFVSQRFIQSNLYEKGEFEIHLFNNYYTQKEKINQSESFNSRYNFFTITGQFIYGLNSKINIGFDLYFRSVNQNLLSETGVFDALKFRNEGFNFIDNELTGYSRIGFSLFGPKIKYQVFPKLGSFSLIHTLLIPIGNDLGGNSETGYLDWGSPVFMNQLYFDKQFQGKWSFFGELGFFLENINSAFLKKDDGFYQISIPSTAILSFYPSSKTTIYGLLSYAGRWENSVSNEMVNTNFNPYYQFGLGAKLLVSQKIEAELLITSFEDEFETRTASTFNLGFRYFSNR